MTISILKSISAAALTMSAGLHMETRPGGPQHTPRYAIVDASGAWVSESFFVPEKHQWVVFVGPKLIDFYPTSDAAKQAMRSEVK
jgi:hypothetical protein